MAAYSFDQFRKVLEKLRFEKVRSKKHETWRKILPNSSILRVRIRHKQSQTIPKWLFYEMLRQAGIDEDGFRKSLFV
ncbi:MAG: type II toxin-antitoxin system HicA family toxin [bacterium]